MTDGQAVLISWPSSNHRGCNSCQPHANAEYICGALATLLGARGPLKKGLPTQGLDCIVRAVRATTYVDAVARILELKGILGFREAHQIHSLGRPHRLGVRDMPQ